MHTEPILRRAQAIRGEFEKLEKRDANRIVGREATFTQVQVYKTKDYKRFEFARENRPVYPNHVDKMQESLAMHGFLIDNPIHVIEQPSGKFLITDGQHRFTAAKNLGLEFYYIIKRDKDPTTDMRVMHAYMRGWSTKDYLHHYVERGFPDYIELKNFVERWGVPINIAVPLLALLSGAARGSNLTTKQMRAGELRVEKEIWTLADSRMRLVNEIRLFSERYKGFRSDRRFMTAVATCVISHEYDHSRMLTALAKASTKLVPCVTTDDYIALINEIYNHGRKVNRADFSRS